MAYLIKGPLDKLNVFIFLNVSIKVQDSWLFLACVISVYPPHESRCRHGPIQQQALLSWMGLLVGGI